MFLIIIYYFHQKSNAIDPKAPDNERCSLGASLSFEESGNVVTNIDNYPLFTKILFSCFQNMQDFGSILIKIRGAKYDTHHFTV